VAARLGTGGAAYRRIASVSLCLLAFNLWCGPAQAQALVPARGEGTLSLTYQNYDVAGHFDAQGRKNTNGGTQSQALVTEFDYGLTDTIGLFLSLPFIASKYTGPPSYFVGPFKTDPGPLDDGAYHSAFQDVRVEVRRLFGAGPVALAPFVDASFPTHNYETAGEAVPGRHRRDIQVGANAEFDLDRISPGSYVNGRYAYGRAERLETFPFTRSNIDVEGGYAATSRIVVRGLMNWQIRHQGPSLDELAADWENHDRFIAPSYIELGGGVSLSVSSSTDVYLLWVATVAGSDGAHRARTLAVGVSLGLWSHLQGLGGASASIGRTARESAGLREQFQ
jgi:hypothetical protein